jgi:3,4-dihydroxy 2-butanone 4-phosphate synthase / GTP cyclohydrolase II
MSNARLFSVSEHASAGAGPDAMPFAMAGTAELIEEARAGRMFILVDDEGRENEGDLVIPAQFATPDAINFMARYGRGLICLAMTRDRVEELRLPLMAQTSRARRQTAFTASVEANEGVTTGISAHDRAHTIAVAINPGTQPADIVSPGHVFPIMARDGGTLIRAGHTEGAVDIARLAGLIPAGVICEIMNHDGTMARLPDLVAFTHRHNLRMGSIADLIAFRSRSETLITRIHEGNLTGVMGEEWNLRVYSDAIENSRACSFDKGRSGCAGPGDGSRTRRRLDARHPGRPASDSAAQRDADDCGGETRSSGPCFQFTPDRAAATCHGPWYVRGAWPARPQGLWNWGADPCRPGSA